MVEQPVTVMIPVRNEADYLEELFADLRAQSYPHCEIEVLLIDNASTDETPAMLEGFAAANDFLRVLLLQNPENNIMSGLNRAFQASQGDFIIRWDAHGRYPADYILRAAERLALGADACGGAVEFRMKGNGFSPDLLLAAERSPFGSGGSGARKTRPLSQVETVFHPSYRRSILERTGLLDVRMIRCEDNELHERIRRAGGEIWYDPAIRSVHYMRPTLGAMLRQKYQNGFGIARLIFGTPECLRLFYLVPFGFVLALLLGAGLLAAGIWQALAGLLLLYFLCGGAAALQSGARGWLLLPGLFFLLHLCYGWGTLCGLIVCLIHPLGKAAIEPLEKRRPQP